MSDNGIELEAVGLQFEPYWWLPCGITWDSSQTVVVVKSCCKPPPSIWLNHTVPQNDCNRLNAVACVAMCARQWPEVYDSRWFVSYFFARCTSQKTHGHARIARVQFSHVRASVFSDSRNVQKRATKSDTSGHCLMCAAANTQHRMVNPAMMS